MPVFAERWLGYTVAWSGTVGKQVVVHIPFDNHFARLGEPFFAKAQPMPVTRPTLIKFNVELARELGISADGVGDAELADLFSGNALPAGAEPLAMAYAGHQFGQFVPQLGDGRAIWLGELRTADGARFDVQLKGSGRTAYSRGGDGRAALGPVLREYLVSEAMHKLGVPTTRALAAVATGDVVARERPLPGGVITRVAGSFIRVGTFQYFAVRGDVAAVKKLADYVIARNYPELADAEQPYVSLLAAVIARQARLIAQWMQFGFIHGVMNTDNMSIAGETIDYGPCAFMDAYAHQRVFSSIDHYGRYAYNSQPGIGLWNLIRLAETLLPLFADDTDQAVKIAEQHLETYKDQYEAAWLARMRAKLGLTAGAGSDEEDRALVAALLDIMDANEADFALTFYQLSRLAAQAGARDQDAQVLFAQPAQFDDWLGKWRERLKRESQSDAARQASMQAINPVYIPRNHQIEAAIRAAEDRGDYSVFYELHAVLQKPFVEQAGKERYRLPPEPEEVVSKTFCGT
ncbi:MAG: YdiU family protein [Pseudomonadota bacterium]|nr:MAG: YdiU family protein [Pseudomonadota bacterium]